MHHHPHASSLHLSAIASALLCLHSVHAAELPVLAEIKPDGVMISSDEQSMLIISSKNNNVLKWNSFNISEDAVLSFDNRNYLNLVTGGNSSCINGTLLAYGNVYIVNPAGISAGVNSSIQAPKLGLITSKIDDGVIENFTATGNLSLPDEKHGMGRVNLLGQINTDNLVVDGGQIVIRDIKNVKTFAGDPLHNRNSERLSLRSSVKRIDIGCDEKSDLKNERNLSGDDLFLHRGETPISTKEELLAVKKDGKYFLTNDLELGELSSPLLPNDPFSGTFDGAYSRISFSQSSSDAFAGLFANLNEAEVNRLFINAVLSVPSVDKANLGGLAANIKNSTLKDLEVHTELLGEIAKDKAFNFGALAGTLEGNNYISNVLALTSQDTVLKLADNSNNSQIKAGLIAGFNNGLLTAEGFSYGMADGSSTSLPQIGKVIGYSTLASSLNEAFDNADDQTQFLKLSEDPSDPELYTNKNFYDPFFSENFALDYDERSPDYIDLSSNQSFYLPYFANTVAKPQTEAGLFEFSLKSKKLSEDKLGRGFYFINTDLNNNQSASLTGLALVTTVVPKPDPEPSIPDPKPTDPDPDPTVPDPEPSVPDPNPEIPEPEPSTPEPEPTDPDPTSPDPEPSVPDPETPEPEPSKPDPEPTDPEPSIPDPEPSVPDPDPETPEPKPSTPEPKPTDPEPSVPDLEPSKPEQDLSQPSQTADDHRDHEKVATTRSDDAHHLQTPAENSPVSELMLRAPKLKQDILERAEAFIQQIYAALTPAPSDPHSKEKEQRQA